MGNPRACKTSPRTRKSPRMSKCASRRWRWRRRMRGRRSRSYRSKNRRRRWQHCRRPPASCRCSACWAGCRCYWVDGSARCGVVVIDASLCSRRSAARRRARGAVPARAPIAHTLPKPTSMPTPPASAIDQPSSRAAELIHRKAQIANAVALWRRQGARPDVHLERRQDKPGRRQLRIALGAHSHEALLGDVTADVYIARLLLGDRALRPRLAPRGRIIVTEIDARLLRQTEQFPDRAVKLVRIAAWEIGASSARVRAENRSEERRVGKE